MTTWITALTNGTRVLDELRTIVANHQWARVKVGRTPIAIDAQTANVMVTVHDALAPENAPRFAAMLHSVPTFAKARTFAYDAMTPPKVT